MRLNPFAAKRFAIDLGNNNTLVRDPLKILISEPSYIAFNANKTQVKAVGLKAFQMYEKNHQELRPVKPLKGGVIADFDSAAQLLKSLMWQANMGHRFFDQYEYIISGIPFSATEVERRALRDALDQFKARHTYLIYEPIAAALGLGLNIREPDGKMVVDLGGGVTEVVVISLSGIAAYTSLKVAGDTFDEAIQDHFRREYNLAIGLRTAEQIKIRVGAVWHDMDSRPEPLAVCGKDFVEGVPTTKRIHCEEICEVLDKFINPIEHGIISTLESCPPELAADIYENGIHITGGNALLRGLRQRLESRIKLPIHIDDEALMSVSKGMAAALLDPKKYKNVLFE